MASLLSVTFGLTISVFGVAMLSDRTFSSWLGWVVQVQNTEPGLRVPRVVVSFNLGGAPVELGPGVGNEP